MIPFQTTPQEVLRLATIVTEMGAAGLDESFIVEAFKLAQTDQGVFDLMASPRIRRCAPLPRSGSAALSLGRERARNPFDYGDGRYLSTRDGPPASERGPRWMRPTQCSMS